LFFSSAPEANHPTIFNLSKKETSEANNTSKMSVFRAEKVKTDIQYFIPAWEQGKN